MMHRMPVKRFQEYYLLEQIEPFGEAGHYYRNALLLSLLGNVYRDSDKQIVPFEVSDFMPDLYNEQGQEVSPEEFKQFMFALKIKQDAILKAKDKAEKEAAEKAAAYKAQKAAELAEKEEHAETD